MSKHNYNQYSKKPKHVEVEKPVTKSTPNAPKVEINLEPEIEAIKPAAPDLIQETVNTVTLPETVEGIVVNCAKLNVRANPDVTAEVVCVLDVTSEIEINVAKSTDDWFYVCTATGVEGYCMRKFIEAYL